MDEIYQAIEEKIKASGYPERVSGLEIYEEICDEIEQKENGTYLFLTKKEDETIFEYQVEVMEDEFNLSILTIHARDGKTYQIDFDN